MDREGRQIYGFIEAKGPPRSISHGGGTGAGDTYTLSYKDTAAVVRRAEERDLSSLPREELFRSLALYQAVIEKAMAHSTVLPIRFGTFAKDDGEVLRILRLGYPRIRRALAAMADKVEIEVVAMWRDLRKVFQAIGEEEGIRALREGIVGRPSAEPLVERLQLGKAVKASLEAQRARCREAILSVLASPALTRDHRVHEGMDDSMILNGAFLMDRHQEGAFDAQVKALDLRFHGSIHFRCVGPLPPYSFSTLEVSRVPSEGVRAACQILGLSEGARLAHVKAAHRRLAHQYHPDRAPEAQERFRAISQAYRLLAECCQKGRLPSAGKEEVIFIKEFRPAGGHGPKGT